MRRTVCVITRQLTLGSNAHRPVPMAVIEPSEDPGINNQENYMRSKANELIESFRSNFVEFAEPNGVFYIDFVETN